MTKLLQRHGNSVSLVFDKSMLESMNITADTPLQITIQAGSMTIVPANVGMPSAEFEERHARIRARYKTALVNLAK